MSDKEITIVPNNLAAIVDHFLYQLESLRETVKVAMPAVADADLRRQQEVEQKLIAFAKQIADFSNSGEAEMSKERAEHFILDRIYTLKPTMREHHKVNRAPQIAANSFFIALFTIFDAFVGSIVRLVASFKPHIISEKTLTLREILAYGSLEKVQADILDKEVENLLRESYSKQFEYFKSKLEIKSLDKGLSSWPEFIEMSQRRNLLVHTGGVVSQQYLDECAKANFAWLDKQAPVLGDKLDVPDEYFQRASFVCFEIGFKLSQVLYRVSAPQ
ncbi:MAG: hypothetical protein ACRYFS_17315, partial [Janthinobacterium lividum]